VCNGLKDSEFEKPKFSALENDGNESQLHGLIEIDEAYFEL